MPSIDASTITWQPRREWGVMSKAASSTCSSRSLQSGSAEYHGSGTTTWQVAQPIRPPHAPSSANGNVLDACISDAPSATSTVLRWLSARTKVMRGMATFRIGMEPRAAALRRAGRGHHGISPSRTPRAACR
jgi:hypothetical protein